MSKSEKPQSNARVAAESVTKFANLPLLPEVQQAIGDVGYETPSPIQASAIPPLLEGSDIIGVAQTGTGKTAAFALPLLTNMDRKLKAPQILCLTPTRELAIQVAEAFKRYANHMQGFSVQPIYGGTDFRAQLRHLERGVQVIVGTPGRVMDHMRRGKLPLNTLKSLVLDEADEMLRMGFIDDVEWILQQAPEKHQTALFSATMPAPIRKLAGKYLNSPVEITIKTKTTTAPNIQQRFISLRNNEKLDVLTRVLEAEQIDAMLVFVRTRNATAEVAERLQARGYAAEPLNGDIPQNQREKVIERLKKGSIEIIVATDVAARGLDVDRITHVLNYDMPYDTESYVHRIGRTGRAGRKGDAILFMSGREKRMLQAIERATRQKITPYSFPSVNVVNERKIEQLFSRIDAEMKKNLGEYEILIKRYLERSQVEPLTLAAAMTSLEYENKPFFVKESERKSAPVKTRREREKAVDRDNTKKDKPVKEKRKRMPAEELELFRLQVGESQGVKKGDIVGAIANEAGIESAYIGAIEIYKDHSTVELPLGMPKSIFKLLKKVWLGGQKLEITRVSAKSSSVGKPSRKSKPAKKEKRQPGAKSKAEKTTK